MTRSRLAVAVLLLAALAGLGLWRLGLPPFATDRPKTAEADAGLPPGPPGARPPGSRRGGPGRGDGPTPVVVSEARHEDVPVTIEGIGTVLADASVTVRAQVEGRLMELRFRDGDEVAAGDVLAVIDPATYRAVYDQAVAKRDQNAADLRNARADLERYDRLAKSEAGSRQQAETQRSMVAKLEAQSRIDQAVIDAAKIDLDNTSVRAPISGRTGIRTVDVGNLVRASDAAGLVTIARIRPITVAFTIPQQRLPALLAAQARGPVAVEVLDADRAAVADRGTVTVIDNQVDSTTGTVKVKATLPNRDTRLWPGQFVDVRVAVDTLRDAVVVPSAAIQRSAEGAHVFVVGDGDVARRRPVEITRQDDRRAVIASGVAVGDRVVTTGFARLTDGGALRPTPAEPEPGAAPRPEDRPNGRPRGEGRPRSPTAGTPDAATDAPGARPGAPPPATPGSGR